MSETQPVPFYGLHGDGDLFFLHEQNRSRCLTPGLEALQSPLEVTRSDRLTCPHSMLPMDPPIPLPELTSELLMKLAPIPDGGCYWAPPAAKPILIEMLAMTRPLRPIAFVPWAHPVKKLVPELNITNLAPLVIADYEARDLRDIARLMDLPRVRTLVLCGQLRVPGATEIKWDGIVPGVAWEQVGTAILQNQIACKVTEARS